MSKLKSVSKKVSKWLNNQKKSLSKKLKTLRGRLPSLPEISPRARRNAAIVAVVAAIIGGAAVGIKQNNDTRRKSFSDGCVLGAAYNLATLFGPGVIEQREEFFRKMCDQGAQLYLDGKIE